MDYTQIQYEVDRGVALVRLDRPGKLNAYTPDMGDQLVDAFRKAFERDDVSAVVLSGNGRAFCAGADRDYFEGKRSERGFKIGEEVFLTDFAAELAACPKLLIAAVNGVASGIGTTMTLPFDLRLASDEASFDFPFVRLGLAPGFASSYYLPRLVGRGSAADVIFNSRRLSAETAQEMGLVQQIIPALQLVPTAMAMARSITSAHPQVVAECKSLINAGGASSLQECMRREQAASLRIAGQAALACVE